MTAIIYCLGAKFFLLCQQIRSCRGIERRPLEREWPTPCAIALYILCNSVDVHSGPRLATGLRFPRAAEDEDGAMGIEADLMDGRSVGMRDRGWEYGVQHFSEQTGIW